MPVLSVTMIRAAFINLWAGFGLAALLIAWKGQPTQFSGEIGGWVLAHVNLLLVGWMVQIAMGVSYWIFPRLAFTVTERGRYGYAYGAAVLLNLGVVCYVLATIIGLGWGQVIGLALQVAALAAYAYHIAPRVRPAVS